jgi:hypothetical protein
VAGVGSGLDLSGIFSVMPARSLQVTFYVTAREQRGSVRLSAQTLNFKFLLDFP